MSNYGSAFKVRDENTSELRKKDDQYSSAGQNLETHRKINDIGDTKSVAKTYRKGNYKQIESDIFCIDDI
jgi:hypothetical protein